MKEKIRGYYHSKNWKVGNELQNTNWKEIAKNFVEDGFKIKQDTTSPFSGYVKRLRNNNKDYGQPL